MGRGFTAKRVRKARKKHVCSCCASLIVKGDMYTYMSGKYEGDMVGIPVCEDCDDWEITLKQQEEKRCTR